MKIRLRDFSLAFKRILISVVLGLVAFLVPVVVSGPVAALTLSNFAVIAPGDTGASGTTCTLPDGRTGSIQSDGHTCCPPNTKDGTSCLFGKYINPAIALLSAGIGIAVAIAIIVGGIEYITSAGDPQRAASGKKRIINALVGLVAFALLLAFLQFIIPGGLFNG